VSRCREWLGSTLQGGSANRVQALTLKNIGLLACEVSGVPA